MTAPGARTLRALPLFWKLLLPFLALMIIVGAAGTFLVVRDLATGARSTLDHDLARASVDVRTALHDRELALLEAVNFAANLQGMPEAVADDSPIQATRLLRSVLALKPDVDLLVVTRGSRDVVSGMANQRRLNSEAREAIRPLASRVLGRTDRKRSAGLLRIGRSNVLAVAAPVCRGTTSCEPVGVAVAGYAMPDLASEVAGSLAGVAFFDRAGHPLAHAGRALPARIAEAGPNRRSVGGLSTLTAPLRVGGEELGTYAVAKRSAPAFAGVRRAGTRLALIVLVAMVGVVAVGALLSKFILGSVGRLVVASRAFGEGRLDERVRAMSDDELGEVARALNQMAEQLQASYETLESRVEQRTAEVQRLLEERTEFFASMSHEFRTPLAVILSESDMVLDAGRRLTVPFARQTVGTIRASAEQLLHVINDILDVAQADAGHIEVDLQPVEVHEALTLMVPTLQGLVKAGELALTLDMPRELPRVLADPARLREVILNLVDNAVKYTPAGGSVIVSAKASDAFVRISVSDTGVGIPSGVGERIFEPFYRVPGVAPVRAQRSTGLGLALAKRFVEAQGGTIGFSSEQNAGTTFTFTLPTTDSIAARRRARRAVRQEQREPRRGRA